VCCVCVSPKETTIWTKPRPDFGPSNLKDHGMKDWVRLIGLSGCYVAALFSGVEVVRAAVPNQSRGLSIDALSKTVWIEDFDVSADGRMIAFKSAEAGTYDIWTVPVSGGAPKQVTSLPGREMHPRFSPDGKWIAFEADNGGVDIRDIYVVPSQGGTPVRLTDHPLDDAGPIWAPDSKAVYFTTEMYWDFAIAKIDLATKRIIRIGKGADDLQLSPDGTQFAYAGNAKPDDDSQSNTDIYVVPVSGGEPRLLTPKTFNSLDVAPRWSPDGRTIAFISDRNGFSNLGVIDVVTGHTRMLLNEAVEHSEPRWSPDGKWISFTKNLNYNYQIFKIAARGGHAIQLTEMRGVNGGSTATGQTRGDHVWLPQGEIVFYHSDPTTTGDLWVTSDAGGPVRRITNHQHPDLRDPKQFVWPEFIEYPSFDGLRVAGLVYKPRGSKAGDKLPALLFLRANSNGQHPVQWHPFIQYFVSRGYLVFAPNFRGSTGRGKAYQQAVFTRGGEDDVHDAFVGLDLLAAQGWIDPQRVGVFGGSTGGYFTTASITKDPARFKAGIVWYGATDLVTLSSYASLESWCKYLIGKTPLENPEAYYKRSIIYHANETRVPLLFLYAQGDRGARFQQIEQYGVQAAIHGNWFDWVEYKGEPHGWYHWKPETIREALTIMGDMFDNFVLGEQHDVKALAEEQRRGTVPVRNPDIELWSALENGRVER
jgi:dipeptidyl aminopeptidase/acylaminoacyl peptidase